MVDRTLRRIEACLAERPQADKKLKETTARKRLIYHFSQSASRERPLLARSNSSEVGIYPNRSEAIRVFSERAMSQQMGLRNFKHVFNPEPEKEMQMIGLSLFSVPAYHFGFIEDPRRDSIWCHSFDPWQSFCVVLANPLEIGEGGEKEVPRDEFDDEGSMETHIMAGVASVMAAGLSIISFHPHEVQAWHQQRHRAGCLYAMRSLRALRDSLRERLNMRTHHTLRSVFAKVRQLVKRGELVQAARAADDLQFHPLHAPDVFLPVDYELTCHFIVLLPFIFMVFVSASFELKKYRLKRKCKKVGCDG
ncbi:unnamed protein product [Phytomonas sp. Hart1]|nr:unnamed protein product [Phytomonas sp. Hart1]|eukprot:CCW67727.1 unnamed protein product [Phytomonas sp. isolate Hart1]